MDQKKYQFAQIAILHYQKGLSQQEIAVKFGFSKMTVSRILQKVKEQDIVQTTVTWPFQLDNKLAKEIISQYKLHNAIVIKRENSTRVSVPELIGKGYAFYMGINLPDDHILGLGVGNTIGQIVQNIVSMKTKNLHIVQLMGGLADVNYTNPFTIVQETCRKLNANGTYMTSYAIVESKELRESIFYNTATGHRVIKLWEQCKEALFGIGAIERGTFLSPQLVNMEEIEKLKSMGAVGDILGHCFDITGNFINTDLEDRLISIPISMLKKIKKRVAVAGGREKARALKGALLSGSITCLVTDELTAAILLNEA